MVLAHNVNEGLRTSDIKVTQDVTFESMLLSSTTLQGLQESGFYKPSPVQLHGIPLGKCGFDLLLEAKSGTGKTAVFSVIALEKLDLSKGLQTVILAPTREIAFQICDVIRQIGSKCEGLNVEVVMGGLPLEEDINKFKKNVHILVGSPGRLRHLIQDKYIDVSFVRLLVLDEADRLMDKSFLHDINFIFSTVPQQKQVILSSATYTENAKLFIKKYVKSVQHICPESNCVLLGIEQKYTIVKFNVNIVRQTQNRFDELQKILSKKTFKQCLIFCNYQARVTELHKLLTKHKWPVEQLYGQQEQTDRLEALKTLQDYKCRILIATDLAARGIDASNVDLVVNFEPPFEWQTYLHRIGRAGRFGSYGMSITILSEGKEEKKFRDMLNLLNAPLNIDAFWTSENNNLNTSRQLEPKITTIYNSLVNNIEDGTKYQELWNELITSERDSENIENFESLCHSFEESKSNIVESFDDLLKSSHNKQPLHAKTDEYQHLQITSQTHEHDSLKVLKEFEDNSNVNIPKKGCKDIVKVNNAIKEENNSEPSCDNEKSKEKEINFILNNHFSNETSETKKDVSKNDGFSLSLERDPKIYKTKNSREMLATTLQSLPTAFVSTKDQKAQLAADSARLRDTANYKNPHNSNLNNNTKGFIPKSSKTKNKNYQLYNQTHVSRDVNRKSNDSYKKTLGNSKLKNSDNSVNENYLHWYNQFKFRMKQIELALYIEELSLL